MHFKHKLQRNPEDELGIPNQEYSYP
jgi:hypothetical protein